MILDKFYELVLWKWARIEKALDVVAAKLDDLAGLLTGLNTFGYDFFFERFNDLDKIEHYHVRYLRIEGSLNNALIKFKELAWHGGYSCKVGITGSKIIHGEGDSDIVKFPDIFVHN